MAPDDLNSVGEWLDRKPEDVVIRTEVLPMAVFLPQITECKSTYLEFPKDEARMRKILRRLKDGEKPYPVFVADGNAQMFIMEGRHRIVAFHEFGLQSVEVAFASPKPGSLSVREMKRKAASSWSPSM